MASFSTLFIEFLSILTIATTQWKSYCNYVVEPGYPSSGLYTNKLSTDYQNITIPARAYSLNYCNWAYDSKINKKIGYKYECSNQGQNILVKLYEDDVNCTSSPVQVTLSSSQTSFNCNGKSCLLAISRYNNANFNTSCSIAPSNQLNSYGLVNGGCAKAVELSYYIKTQCDASNPTYFLRGYYADDDTECQFGPGINAPSARLVSNTCPGDNTDSNTDNDIYGKLGYVVQTCEGDPFQTTMPDITTIEPTTANPTSANPTTANPTKQPTKCLNGNTYFDPDDCIPQNPCSCADQYPNAKCTVGPCDACTATWTPSDQKHECNPGADGVSMILIKSVFIVVMGVVLSM